MKNQITKEKLESYRNITEQALAEAKKAISKSKKQQAQEIIEMVSCYLADSKFFEKQEDYVNAFAAINYAHGWLDSGARLKIFKVTNTKLFAV